MSTAIARRPSLSAWKDEYEGLRANLAQKLLSDQMPEMIAAHADFKTSLVGTPGLTGLEYSPDGRPAKRSLPVQAHMPGDGSARCRIVVAGGWAAGEDADSRAGIAEARSDRCAWTGQPSTRTAARCVATAAPTEGTTLTVSLA